jgi:Carboxypeptidase regulatory-like domain
MKLTSLNFGARLAVACVSLLLSFVSLASAQTASTGALTGTVTDATGAAIRGVQVKLTNEATGEVRTVVAQQSGSYIVPLLLPGTYRVEFSGTGFKQSVKPGLRINVTETAKLDIQLEPGAVEETVTVTSEAQLLQTESAALGRVADQVLVTNLPLVSRNYTQIITLSPGIAAPVTRSDALGRGNGGESGGAFRAQGGFGRDNNFQMNGLPINDLQASGSFSGGVAVPNPDAIEQFKVQTGQYDSSFGRNAGANVNVVTKSGTNDFHGTVFEFFRNDALNANDFFRNSAGQPRGVLKQNQFGFTLGGPVWKDKVLFFGSYQGTRQRNGVSGGSTSNFFSPAFTSDRSRATLGALFAGQTGAFGGIPIAADGSNISAPALALLNLKHPNGEFVIPTPQTINPTQPFARRGFSAVSVPGKFDEDQFLVNMDFLHTDKSKFSGRFYAGDSDLVLPLPTGQTGAPSVPGFPYLIPNTFRNFSASHTYTISSSLVNQIDFGYHKIDVGNLQQEVFKFSDIGVTAPPVANMFPVVGVSGSLATGGNGQSVRVLQDHFTLQDSLTYISGRHTFRFGGGFTRSKNAEEDFTFFGGLIFASWPDFLLGLPGGDASAGGNGTPSSNVFISIDIPGDLDREWIAWDGNAYIQDDIKVTPSFTLNLGLRYERLGHLADTGGRNTGFDIALANPNPPAGGTLAGYLVSENYPGTVPPGVTQLDNQFGVRGRGQNNLGPRLGFAWMLPRTSLPFMQQMVLRGGYGIYYTRATGQAFLQLATGQPFASLRQLVLAPNLSFANPFLPEPALPAFIPYSPTTQLSLTLIDPEYRPPITQQYSLNLQTGVGRDFLLEVGYVGSRGNHQIYRHTLNQARLASASNPIRGLMTNTRANITQRVPILGFTPLGLQDVDSSGNSWYNGMEVSVTKRLSKGLQFLAAYTFAHAYNDAFVTDASGFSFSGNQSNRRANYGRDVSANREHRFILSYVYQLPSPKRFNSFVNGLLGGWSVAGVTTIQSGLPLSFFGNNANNVYGIAGDRAQLVAGCTHEDLVNPGTVKSRLRGYYNRTCINGLTATGGAPVWRVIGDDGIATDFGNSGVGIVTGPGQNNFDIAIIKRTPFRLLGESSNIEFRTEFFNAFNHAQFGNPDSNASNPTFGVISATSVNPRIIQFALKLNF